MSNELMLSVIDGEHETYLSAKVLDPQKKIELLNAIMNPQHRVSDSINLTINVTDIYAEIVDMEKKVDGVGTGEMVPTPRVILIDDNSEGHQCVSWGIYSALQKIITFMGAPTWEPALPLRIGQVKKGTNSILTLSVDTGKGNK